MALTEVEGLKAVRSRNPHEKYWCGPTAIAAVIGCSYVQAKARISMVRGSPFRSTSNLPELQKVMENEGYTITALPVHGKPTLQTYLRERTAEQRDMILMIRVNGHFLVAHGDNVCDSYMTVGRVMPYATLKRGMRTEVTHVLAATPPSTGGV